MSPNNGMLFNGVLRPKLFNIPLAFCFLKNFDFLPPHIAHFDNIIVLPLLVFQTRGFVPPVFFLHLNNNMTCFIFETLNFC